MAGSGAGDHTTDSAETRPPTDPLRRRGGENLRDEQSDLYSGLGVVNSVSPIYNGSLLLPKHRLLGICRIATPSLFTTTILGQRYDPLPDIQRSWL